MAYTLCTFADHNTREVKKELRAYVQNDRKDFKKETLDESDVESGAFRQFEKWFGQTLKSEVDEPYAFTLATVGANGRPSARVVYMRDLRDTGIVFYTNYESDKGNDLAANPFCSANFFWPELQRQVRISGKAERLTAEDSNAYFASRPRASQIGAWASDQSSSLTSRKELLAKIERLKERFEGGDVPRPDHWGGYLIVPVSVEFWQGRESRLHDRILYSRDGEGEWTTQRLSP